MDIGIVAFSYALRGNGPSPCNTRLAKETERASNWVEIVGDTPVTVAQREVNSEINRKKLNVLVRRSVERPSRGYLGSEQVANAAAKLFREESVTEVIVIAHPFLQLTKCKREMVKQGFHVRNFPVSKIGFDKKSSQWWTRGYIRSFIYAVLQVPRELFSPRGR